MAVKTPKKKSTGGISVTETATTFITFLDGIKKTYQIRPETTSRGMNIVVMAPCGDDVEMTKEVAIAVATALLKTANAL